MHGGKAFRQSPSAGGGHPRSSPPLRGHSALIPRPRRLRLKGWVDDPGAGLGHLGDPLLLPADHLAGAHRPEGETKSTRHSGADGSTQDETQTSQPELESAIDESLHLVGRAGKAERLGLTHRSVQRVVVVKRNVPRCFVEQPQPAVHCCVMSLHTLRDPRLDPVLRAPVPESICEKRAREVVLRPFRGKHPPGRNRSGAPRCRNSCDFPATSSWYLPRIRADVR